LESLGNTHPLIPDLFAFFELDVPGLRPGKSDPFFYLVQEYIDGLTLEEVMQQKGLFNNAEIIELLEEILPVLTFVHENGTIHRDIKLSNIMRHRNGHYYLLDFGAVRQVTKGGGGSTGIYSEGYAPPEQMAGGEVYPSTDLYALAVTCVMLLTGKEPKDLYDSFNNTWRWRSFVSQIQEPLAAVLDRMLLFSPSARFQSAQEVLAALQIPVASGYASPLPTAQGATPPSVTPPYAAPPTTLGNQPPINLQPSTPAPIQSSSPQARSRLGRRRGNRQPFGLLELLGNAGFWGVQSCLLAIALFSLPLPLFPWLNASLWLLLSALLILLQSRRWIEREDLPLLALLTLVSILFVPPLHQILGNNSFLLVIMLAALVGLGTIAIVALFQLLYRLFQNFF